MREKKTQQGSTVYDKKNVPRKAVHKSERGKRKPDVLHVTEARKWRALESWNAEPSILDWSTHDARKRGRV